LALTFKSFVSPPKPEELAHRRFLSDKPVLYESVTEAARSYVSKLEIGDIGWLHSKPFDPTPGNPQYFRLMFDLLNILQAMELPPQAKILEVGSGPGWVTEVLLMLGFSVDSLEPSADLIQVARERCAALAPHYRHTASPKLKFHQSTLEETEFNDESFDAVLFFDVLHHVVDEHVAMEKSFRFLKPGGCLGIVEGAWHPDYKELERALIVEMEKFGTLENPFSTEYLDYLLRRSGFIEIQRYSAVNGFFSAPQLRHPLEMFSATAPSASNNITARKPSKDQNLFPSCTNFRYRTSVRLLLVSGGIDSVTRTAALSIRLDNQGETLLDNHTTSHGYITLALRRGEPGSKAFVECNERHLLSKTLHPGQSLDTSISYTLPIDVELTGWELDIVAEGVFWFSTRNIKSCPVPCIR
jgi:SAM-dependent methyltransferase